MKPLITLSFFVALAFTSLAQDPERAAQLVDEGIKLTDQQEYEKAIKKYEAASPKGLNGFILLLHIGTDPKRTDKFYAQLPNLIKWLKEKGYKFERIDQLLKE